MAAEFDRNLAYIMKQVGTDVQKSSGYPDGPASEYQAKLASGEEPPLTASETASTTVAAED